MRPIRAPDAAYHGFRRAFRCCASFACTRSIAGSRGAHRLPASPQRLVAGMRWPDGVSELLRGRGLPLAPPTMQAVRAVPSVKEHEAGCLCRPAPWRLGQPLALPSVDWEEEARCGWCRRRRCGSDADGPGRPILPSIRIARGQSQIVQRNSLRAWGAWVMFGNIGRTQTTPVFWAPGWVRGGWGGCDGGRGPPRGP